MTTLFLRELKILSKSLIANCAVLCLLFTAILSVGFLNVFLNDNFINFYLEKDETIVINAQYSENLSELADKYKLEMFATSFKTTYNINVSLGDKSYFVSDIISGKYYYGRLAQNDSTTIRSGKQPEKSDEIMLSDLLATYLGCNIGDKVLLDETRLTVCGTYSGAAEFPCAFILPWQAVDKDADIQLKYLVDKNVFSLYKDMKKNKIYGDDPKDLNKLYDGILTIDIVLVAITVILCVISALLLYNIVGGCFYKRKKFITMVNLLGAPKSKILTAYGLIWCFAIFICVGISTLLAYLLNYFYNYIFSVYLLMSARIATIWYFPFILLSVMCAIAVIRIILSRKKVKMEEKT